MGRGEGSLVDVSGVVESLRSSYKGEYKEDIFASVERENRVQHQIKKTDYTNILNRVRPLQKLLRRHQQSPLENHVKKSIQERR